MSKELLQQALDALATTNSLLKRIAPFESEHMREINEVMQALNQYIAQPVQPTNSDSIEIDLKQATELLEMFGGEPTTLTLIAGKGHSGTGLYAYYTEIPEEGFEYLGEADDEAVPEIKVAQPVQPYPVEPISRYGSPEMQALILADLCKPIAQPVLNLKLDGDQWCATWPDFINLQESAAGFGNTPELAISALREAIARPVQPAIHDSDCSLHNEPACPAGPCDCRLATEDVRRSTLKKHIDHIALLEYQLKHQKERFDYMEMMYKTLPVIGVFSKLEDHEEVLAQPVHIAQAEPLSDSIAQPSTAKKVTT